MKLRYPVEYIKWIDHFSVDEWKQVEDIDAAPAPVESVGWIVKENEAVVVLAVNACSKSEETEVSCTMVIMRSCIIERKRLVECQPKKKKRTLPASLTAKDVSELVTPPDKAKSTTSLKLSSQTPIEKL